MIPFKFNFPTSASVAIALFIVWLVYMALYWRGMIHILRATSFTTQDKILWFLVITLAPVLGLITFHAMCPPHVLNGPPRQPPTTD